MMVQLFELEMQALSLSASNVTNEDKREIFVKELAAKQENLRVHYSNKDQTANSIAFVESCENRFKTKTQIEHTPKRIGVFTEHITDLEELSQYIDWSPFFWAWELKGTYPKILENKKYGEQATKLFEDAQEILKDIIDKAFQAKIYLWNISRSERR